MDPKFFCEPLTLTVFQHPFIVSVRFCFFSLGRFYIVFDHLATQLFSVQKEKSKHFSQEQSKFYLAELLSALRFIGTPFRLASRHLMLDWDGHLVVCGFPRLAPSQQRLISEASRNVQSMQHLENLEFLAPEIARGEQKIDSVCSLVWSFGVIAYRLLVGRSLFADCSNIFQALFDPSYSIRYDYQHLTNSSKQFLKALLIRDPTKRIDDWQKVANLEFFEKLPWQAVEQRKLAPPFAPTKMSDHRDPTKSAMASQSRSDTLLMDQLPIDLQRFGKSTTTLQPMETYIAPALIGNVDWSGATIVSTKEGISENK